MNRPDVLVREHDDTDVFLTACARLLHENVLQLEAAASRVSELVLVGARPDPGLVVALQAFDRLKQAFEALSHALAVYGRHCGAAHEDRQRYVLETVDQIGLADLRERMLDHIAPALPESPVAECEQMEMDVEF